MLVIWWIIVGLIAGFITGKLMKGSGFGPLMDIVIGILGAVIGGFIMRSLGFAGQGGMIYTVAISVFGAVLLTLLLRLVTRGRRTRAVRNARYSALAQPARDRYRSEAGILQIESLPTICCLMSTPELAWLQMALAGLRPSLAPSIISHQDNSRSLSEERSPRNRSAPKR